MLTIWITAAAMAGVTGKIEGQAFEAKAAIAGPGTEPGTVVVVLMDLPLKCDDKSDAHPIMVMLGFDAVAGAAMTGAMLSTPKTAFDAVDGTATLATLPTEVGGTGRIVIRALAAKKTSISGEIDFTLCEPIPPSAPPTATFAAKDLTFGEGGDKMVFNVPVPDWTSEVDFAGRTVWIAPDKVTKFWVDSTCDGACDPSGWEAAAKQHAKTQISGYASTPGYTAKIWKDESPRPGLQITEFGYGADGGSATVALDVLAWGDAWPLMGQCHAETIEKYASFLDEAEKACLAMTRVP